MPYNNLKKIDITPDWNYEEVMRVPTIRGGPMREYLHGQGQSQLAAVMPITLDDSEQPETVNARRKADVKLMVAAPKMYRMLEETRNLLLHIQPDVASHHQDYIDEAVREINDLLASTHHYE